MMSAPADVIPSPGVLDDIVVGARFASSLPRLFRKPLDLAVARRLVADRLRRRAEDLLDHLRVGVYSNPTSPYRDLLRHAGCEVGDVEGLVRAEGVEGALHRLYRSGVYLTIDEFKGRRPAVRGSTTVYIDPARLRNPRSMPHLPARSGGSRSAGTSVVFDLAFVEACAADTGLVFAARGGTRWKMADWEVPGSASLFRLIEWTHLGMPPVRWFSQVDTTADGLHPRYRWSMRLFRGIGALCGIPLPRPQYVPVDDPRTIARWIREVLDQGDTPHLFTFVSSAVRLCQAARTSGMDLTRAQFTLVGEPLTAARLHIIRGAGAVAMPRYGANECGIIAHGCLAPAASDDVHLLADLQAVVQPGAAARPDVPTRALLITSLHPASPFVTLNVAMGDAASMRMRACGCPLQELGWPVHLDTIRSYEKLTAAGMTFLDTDVVRVLEDVLPGRFGGTPTDYQLVESEDAEGRSRLRLLVHPRLGALDVEDVVTTFLQAVGAGAGAERVMGLVWKEADLLRIERREPLTTRAGKILHLHVESSRA
jgi:hypothetical protein